MIHERVVHCHKCGETQTVGMRCYGTKETKALREEIDKLRAELDKLKPAKD